MKKISLLCAFAALALSACTTSMSDVAASGTASQCAPTPAAVQAEGLAMVNAQRAQAGLAPLTLDARLQRAAEIHACDMATKEFMNHTGSDGSSARDRIHRAGYDRTTMVAENIGFGPNMTTAQIIAAWKGSSGHRANTEHPGLTQMGLARVVAQNGWTVYWAQTFGTPSRN